MKANWQYIAAGAAALAVVYLLAVKGAAKSLGQSAGGAAADLVVGAVDGAAGGLVFGVGDAIGLPRTDTQDAKTRVQIAMDEQDEMAVSLYAPAMVFLSWLWQGRPKAKDFKP